VLGTAANAIALANQGIHRRSLLASVALSRIKLCDDQATRFAPATIDGT